MRILLFGSTGGVGRSLISYLLQSPKSHIVTAVARNPTALTNHPQHDHTNLRIVKGDLKDVPFVEQQVAEHDAVIFAAGCPDPMSARTPDGIYTESAKNIRRAILRAQQEVPSRRIRFIGVTSASVIQGIEPHLPFVLRYIVIPFFLKPAYDEMRVMEAEFHDPDSRAEEIDWTFVQPPRLLDCEPKGTYRVVTDTFIKGSHEIGRNDLAAFMVEKIVDNESGEFRGKRVMVGY